MSKFDYEINYADTDELERDRPIYELTNLVKNIVALEDKGNPRNWQKIIITINLEDEDEA